MTPKIVPALLRKAGAVIRSQGLHKGDWYPPRRNPWRSPVCLVGALYLAAGIDPKHTCDMTASAYRLVEGALKAVHAVLRDDYGEKRCATTWADAEDRTREHVLTLLAEAERAVS